MTGVLWFSCVSLVFFNVVCVMWWKCLKKIVGWRWCMMVPFTAFGGHNCYQAWDQSPLQDEVEAERVGNERKVKHGVSRIRRIMIGKGSHSHFSGSRFVSIYPGR